MNFQELLKKKVGGVPVLYIAGAFVAILTLVAWKLKPSIPAVEETSEDAGAEPGVDDLTSDYAGLSTGGTVTVVQSPVAADADTTVQTNEDWLRDGVALLISEKHVSGTEAQSALSKYLDGADLSFEEKGLVDFVIATKKLPPDGVGSLGTIGTQPAQKQFSNFPGKHTVKGSNDNSPSKIAALYYGSGAVENARLIAGANSVLGAPGVTYTPGTVITVPAYHSPKWYTVKGVGDTTAKGVASKNGMTEAGVRVLNTGHSEPYAKGSKVRVA